MNFEAPLTQLVWLTSIVSVVLTYVVSYLAHPRPRRRPDALVEALHRHHLRHPGGRHHPRAGQGLHLGRQSRHVREVVTTSREGGASLNILSGFVAGNFSAFWLGLTIMVPDGGRVRREHAGRWAPLMLAPAVFAFGLVAFGFLGMGPVTIAVDSYGPVTDNAQSVYELSTIEQIPGIEAEIKRDFGFAPNFEAAKELLEENDGAGNTFKATAKPVLIGTAVVGATTMIFSIIMALTHGLQPSGIENLSILHPPFLLGLITGGAVIYWFTGASTQAVTTGAYRAVEFIKANIRLEGVTKASVEDSKKVVEICTQYAQKGMFNIFLGVFFSTLAFAFVEPYFFIGYLISIALFGLYQAIFMANAGGAWDNAKKIVETELKMKGTELHAATVVGDTVGDPFKDTSSVALNPIIKFTTLFGLLAVELARVAHQEQGAGLSNAARGGVPRGRAGLRVPVVLRDADRNAGARGGASGGAAQGLRSRRRQARSAGAPERRPRAIFPPSLHRARLETPMPEHREDLDRRGFLGHAAVLGAAAAGGVKVPDGAGAAAALLRAAGPRLPVIHHPGPVRARGGHRRRAAGRHVVRPLHGAGVAQRYLDRIAAMDRRRVAPRHHRDQSRRADAAPRRSTRSAAQGRPRPAARHSGPGQGQHRHRRPDDDHRGLAGARGPPRRATRIVAERLRAAGAVLLGKTNLSEWANIRSTHSSSGWSARGGLTPQPVRARPQPLRLELGHGGGRRRPTSAPSAVGTETDGSIVCPRRQRHRRAQADRRPGEPRRHHPDLAQPGHGRADGAHAWLTRPSCSVRWRASTRATRDRPRRRQRAPDYTASSTPGACAAPASAWPAEDRRLRRPVDR